MWFTADLYDVINLFRNADARPAAAVLRDVLGQKCKYKGMAIPVFADMEPHRADLHGGWQTTLAHQLVKSRPTVTPAGIRPEH